jgi:ATP-binding cassette subfamily F protein uup
VIQLRQLTLARGARHLIEDGNLQVHDGWRVGLVGANGSGKSSLFALLLGELHPEAGDCEVPAHWRIASVSQETPALEQSALEYVLDGDTELRAIERALAAAEHAHDGHALAELHARLEAVDGYAAKARAASLLAGLGFESGVLQRTVASFSGGWRMRLNLARALLSRADLMLLDEPTNHLDLDAIEWLQGLLTSWSGALVFVSHDRAFIDVVATRIIELDRGVLRSYPGNYAAYELTQARELESEALASARADKLLAAEEVWVRKGVEARRTRAVGRIVRLERLREQRAARRESLGQVRLEIDSGVPSGKLVAVLDDVSFRFGPQAPWLIDRFTATFLRGDKVGLVGPNGVGKTTLLKLILGQLEPTRGTVRRGSKLQVAYFDQMRDALDLDATLADTISPGSEWIESGGQKKHVMSYLNDFLFSPARANSPVRTLSGGERNRLLLARLFALPANVIVLDEPTNDLDIDTLELLEELLLGYSGTAFIVSHDRRFVDAVVTSTVAWEGDPAFGGRPGLWREYEGGITDWQTQRARARVVASVPVVASAPPIPAPAAAMPRSKLSYKEQRELDALPARIAALEAEQKAIAEAIADPSLYARDAQRATDLHARYAQIDDELLAALERWEALSAR